MAPTGQTEMAVDRVMNLNAAETDGDIDMPLYKSDSPESHIDRPPKDSDCGVTGTQAQPGDDDGDGDGTADNARHTPNGMPRPNNTVTIYDQLAALDPHRLPYSHMIEHPGQVPRALLSLDGNKDVEAWVSKIRKPRFVRRVPIDHYRAFNIEGEKALELQIKRIRNPVKYLLVVRGFRLLLAIRNMSIKDKPVISAKLLGLFIGRIFCGDVGALKTFNKHFLPENLAIVPTAGNGAIHRQLKDLRARFGRDKAFRSPEVVQLLRLLNFLAEEPFHTGQRRHERIGVMMIVKSYTDIKGNRVEVPPGGRRVPDGAELPRCLGLSPQFMGYHGPKWPFRMHPKRVDVCGLLNRPPLQQRQGGKGPVGVCPQQCYKVTPLE